MSCECQGDESCSICLEPAMHNKKSDFPLKELYRGVELQCYSDISGWVGECRGEHVDEVELFSAKRSIDDIITRDESRKRRAASPTIKTPTRREVQEFVRWAEKLASDPEDAAMLPWVERALLDKQLEEETASVTRGVAEAL